MQMSIKQKGFYALLEFMRVQRSSEETFKSLFWL